MKLFPEGTVIYLEPELYDDVMIAILRFHLKLDFARECIGQPPNIEWIKRFNENERKKYAKPRRKEKVGIS
jgi:hypothetical protein